MTTVTLTTRGGGFIDSDAPTTTNSGSTFYASGHFSTPQTNRMLLWFNASSIPRDAVVSAATLKITVDTNFIGANHTLNFYRVRRRWYMIGTSSSKTWASQATWNRYRSDKTLNWSTAGAGDTTNDRDSSIIGSVALTSASAGTLSITLDTTMVQAWMDGTFPLEGLIGIASDESGTTLMRWKHVSNGTAANRPQIDITYTSAIESTSLLTGLVAYYKQDSNPGQTIDSSGNAHTLTAVNSPTSAAGKVGEAAHLVTASNQYFTNNDAALKLSTGDFTVSAWVKLTDNTDFYTTTAQGDETGVAGTGAGGFKAFYHKVSVLDYFVAQLYDNGDGIIDNDPVIADPIAYNGGNPATGSWHHVVVRHDSVRRFLHIFINGATPDSAGHHDTTDPSNGQDCAYSASATPATHANPFIIGARMAGGTTIDDQLNGDIDEVAVWSRCLSDTDIRTTLYNGGAGYEVIASPSGGSTRKDRQGAINQTWFNRWRGGF